MAGQLSDSRTALVTGGAGGIGLSVVARFLKSNLNVAVVDVQPNALQAARERLNANANADADALYVQADVTDAEQVNRALAATVERFGSVDILVNVAGGSGTQRVRQIDEIDLDAWDHVISLNLRSAFLFCRAVVPTMRDQRFGRIVNFSSIAARGEVGPVNTVAGRLPYATAKAALIGFTAQLAKDVAEYGITVYALAPGLILGEQGTRIRDRFDGLAPDVKAQMLSRYPMGRAGSADEVAATVEFLTSDAAAYISGTTIAIDGAG